MYEITNSQHVQCQVLSPELGRSRRWLGLTHLRLAFTRKKTGAEFNADPFFLAPGAALVPAQQGAQLHQSCAGIRDPAEKCGLNP